MKIISVAFLVIMFIFSGVHLTCAQGAVEADPPYYGYYPTSPLSLGSGFDLSDVRRVKSPAFKDSFIQNPKTEPGGNPAASLNVLLVKDASQLQNALHLDTKIDGRYLTFEGGASFSYSTEHVFDEDSATFIVTALIETPRQYLPVTVDQLNDDAKKLLNHFDAFRKQFGTRFVQKIRRGSSVSAIITIHGLNSRQQDAIKAAIHGSQSGIASSVNGEINFNTLVSQASQQGRLQVQVVSTGGNTGSVNALASLIQHSDATTQDPLKSIETDLGKLLEDVAQHPVPLGFWVESFAKRFGMRETPDLWTTNQESKLRDFVEQYRQIESMITTAQEILASETIGDNKRNSLNSAITNAKKRQTVLAAAHHVLLNGGKPDLKEETLQLTNLISDFGSSRVFRFIVDDINVITFPSWNGWDAAARGLIFRLIPTVTIRNGKNNHKKTVNIDELPGDFQSPSRVLTVNAKGDNPADLRFVTRLSPDDSIVTVKIEVMEELPNVACSPVLSTATYTCVYEKKGNSWQKKSEKPGPQDPPLEGHYFLSNSTETDPSTVFQIELTTEGQFDY